MTKLIVSLILVGLVIFVIGMVGCTAAPVVPQQPNPTINEDVEARLVDRTWISPAMVQIGNYYSGARAEWSLRLHNGKDTPVKLVVSPRKAGYTKESYFIAPSEIQDWVIVADSTPVLAPKETKEILVVLAMPKEIDDKTAYVWQVTSVGLSRLDTIRGEKSAEYLKGVKASEWYIKEMEIAKAQGGIERIEAQAQGKAQAILKKFLDTDQEANLLVYFEGEQSVNVKQFDRERIKDVSFSSEFFKKGFLTVFDLRKQKWEFWVSVVEQTGGMVQTEMCSRWLVVMRG